MRFVGVDIASETHVFAVVDEAGKTVLKPTAFKEDSEGYKSLVQALGEPKDVLVAMEATGHYWKNLFAHLASGGFQVALLNPLRTRRFAEVDLERAKTDALDALTIARFAAQKRPAATPLTDAALEQLRELVRLRERLMQQFGDTVRQLHRLVDLGFPEFTRYVKDIGSELAVSLLRKYPTAKAFADAKPRALRYLRYDGRHFVGKELADQLMATARVSVGAHHAPAWRIQVHYACEDLTTLRQRLRTLDNDIERKLREHEVGSLLTSIEGIGPLTAARLVAELGDPAAFRDAKALASYVGVVPATTQSGKSQRQRAGLSHLGNARLRHALWMPTLTAVRKNPWLRRHYEALRARGKLPKVALIACMRKLLSAVYSVAKHRKPFVSILPSPDPSPAPA